MADTVVTVTREQVLRYRWHANQLDAAADSAAFGELASFDLGVQEGAGQAGTIGLVNRGVPVDESVRVTSRFTDALALAWTLRGAPHYYRRDDLADVQVAVSPFSEADAAKRAITGGKDLAAAGIATLDGMRAVATAMRDAMPRASTRDSHPTLTKGELSGLLHEVLPRAFQVDCRACGVVHPHEQLFRISALHAGLEHEPATGPPSLRRTPGWPRRDPGPARDPFRATQRIQPIRAYLHLLGPTTPRDVATYLETNMREVTAHWPDDAVHVEVEGAQAWMFADDLEALAAAAERPLARDREVRLLSGFDLLLAAKDRGLLVPERTRHKEVWPVIGRPGVVVLDGVPIGTWRPKSAGQRLTLNVGLWGGAPPARGGERLIAAIEAQAERVAAARGRVLSAVNIAS